MKINWVPNRQNDHVISRALNRYGLDFDSRTRKTFIRFIKEGKTQPVKSPKTTLKRKIHDIYWQGEVYRVVYDKRLKTIITFLPIEGER